MVSRAEVADVLRLRVARRVVAAEGVVVLELRHPTGSELSAWSPGAHLDLRLPGGLVRQYSLCGDPADRRTWRIAVRREDEGRGGSLAVHASLTTGIEVEVHGPRNHFELVASPRYLFVAGGIGITPILPMVAAAEAAGARWELHYGGRDRRSMPFLEELDGFSAGRVVLYPQDEVGLPDVDALVGEPRPGTLLYCCGPEALIEAVEEQGAEWPDGAIHVERFAPRGMSGPVIPGSFEVELARSGRTLTVPPEKSVLQVLDEAGVATLSWCRDGVCGTCETRVLRGEVDHRDSILTTDERAANDLMYVCVSRAVSARLVLDL